MIFIFREFLTKAEKLRSRPITGRIFLLGFNMEVFFTPLPDVPGLFESILFWIEWRKSSLCSSFGTSSPNATK